MSNTAPQGFQGILGPQGLVGYIGSTGPIGSQGTQGIQGLQGAQGIEGYFGTNDSGFQGLQGLQGSQGFQGDPGTRGVQGSQGPLIFGPQGLQGLQAPVAGTTGLDGFDGAQGIQGYQGPPGEGLSGLSGFHGSRRGAQGSQGNQGGQGLQGFQGPTISGSQGSQGYQGKNLGETGYTGLSGSQGRQASTGSQGSQGTSGHPKIDSFSNVVLFDDFIGPSLSSIYPVLPNGSVTTYTRQQGFIRVKSGLSLPGGFVIATSTTDTWIKADTNQLPIFEVAVDTNVSNTRVLIGLADSNKISTITNGLYWKYDDDPGAKWQCISEASNVVTSHTTADVPSFGTLQKLKIVVTAAASGTASFYFNNVLAFSFTGISSATKLRPVMSIETKGSQTKSMYIDYVYLNITRA